MRPGRLPDRLTSPRGAPNVVSMRTRSKLVSAVVVLGALVFVAYFATRPRERHEHVQVDGGRDDQPAIRSATLEGAEPAASTRATVASEIEPQSSAEVEASADTKLARVRFRPASNDPLWSTGLREHGAEAYFILVGASDEKSCLGAGLSSEGVAELSIPEGSRLFADAVHCGDECWIPASRSPLEFSGNTADCDVDRSEFVEVRFEQWLGPDRAVAVDVVEVFAARIWLSEFTFDPETDLHRLSFSALKRNSDDGLMSAPAADLCGAPPVPCANPPSGPTRLRRRFASEGYWASSPMHRSRQFAVPVKSDGAMTVHLQAVGVLGVEVIQESGAQETGLVLSVWPSDLASPEVSQPVVPGEVNYFRRLPPGVHQLILGKVEGGHQRLVSETKAQVTGQETTLVQLFYPAQRVQSNFTIVAAPGVDLSIIRGGDLRFAPLGDRNTEGTLVEESGVPLTWGPVDMLAGAVLQVAIQNPPLIWTCTVPLGDPTIELPIHGFGTLGLQFVDAQTREPVQVDTCSWQIAVDPEAPDANAGELLAEPTPLSASLLMRQTNVYRGEARAVDSIDLPFVNGLLHLEIAAKGYGTLRESWPVVGDGGHIPKLVSLSRVTTINLVPTPELGGIQHAESYTKVTLIEEEGSAVEIAEHHIEMRHDGLFWVFKLVGTGPCVLQVPINANGDTRRVNLELEPGTTQTVKL